MAATVPEVIAHVPIVAEWVGGSQFEAGRAAGPRVRIDGDAQTAPSPFDLLLAALATCASVDVVSILQKQRTPPQALSVRVEAMRVAATPRRLASAVLHFSIRGRDITAPKAARAVELSVAKYCSVRSSLLEEVPVTWTIELAP